MIVNKETSSKSHSSNICVDVTDKILMNISILPDKTKLQLLDYILQEALLEANEYANSYIFIQYPRNTNMY